MQVKWKKEVKVGFKVESCLLRLLPEEKAYEKCACITVNQSSRKHQIIHLSNSWMSLQFLICWIIDLWFYMYHYLFIVINERISLYRGTCSIFWARDNKPFESCWNNENANGCLCIGLRFSVQYTSLCGNDVCNHTLSKRKPFDLSVK